MSSKPHMIILSLTVLMVLVMGYAFEMNAYANGLNVDDNLPMIVQSFNIGNLVPLNA